MVLAAVVASTLSSNGVARTVLGIVGAVVTAAVLLTAASLLASFFAMYLLGFSRVVERKAAGWTKSKRSASHVVSAPPAPPRWTVEFLAADRRVAAPGAFQAAQETLLDLTTAGDVVETVAATPNLARLYERAGFQRWHPASLAMWRVY